MILLQLSALVPHAGSAFSGALMNHLSCQPLARRLTWWLIACMALASCALGPDRHAGAGAVPVAQRWWRCAPTRACAGSPGTTTCDMATHAEATADVSGSKLLLATR